MAGDSDDEEKTGDGHEEKTIVGTGVSDTVKMRLEKAKQSPPAVVLLIGPSRQVGKQWQLLKTNLILGRAMEADIFVDEKAISRKHAQFLMTGEKVFVEDLGSSNGTFVNNQRIDPQNPVQLKDNDQIRTGSTVIFKFYARGNVESVSNQELYNQNQLDALTQIHNRRALNSTGAEMFKRARVTEIPLTVLVFDIDHFKKVNDTFSHAGGDHVLRELSRIIKDDLIRKEDFFARYGGEEFCLILFGSDLQRGVEVADRIRVTIEKHQFVFQGQSIPVTISVGVASIELGMGEWDELIQLADQALYKSKNAGRNRVSSA